MRISSLPLRSASLILSVGLGLPASVGAAEKGGELVGHFYGNFSYSIPIEVPAYHGLEPRLALSYSAGGGNGQVGVGWTLSGLSTIDTPYNYYLDGQELISCAALPPGSGASCTAGGNYTTKNESYLKITTSGGLFYVYGRDGTRTTFSPTISGFRYGQTSVVDTKNNTASYAWNCTGGDCYPGTISYNGYSVTFYSEPRTDPPSFGTGSAIGTTLYRLRSIAVRQGTNLIRAYKISYSTSAATGRSLLTEVRQYGKDAVVDANGAITAGTSLPAQTFTYQNDAIAHQFTPTASGSGTSWCSPNEQYFLKTGDFNGDGKTDLLCSEYGNIRVALSNGTGFNAPTVWSSQVGIGGGILLNDFNNDGKTDFAFVGSSEGDVTISVSLSTGSQFQPLTQWGLIQSVGSCATVHTGDFNGDGFADLWCRRYTENADQMVGLSNGSGFSFGSWGNQGCDGVDRIVDMDGDWKDDWVRVGRRGARVPKQRIGVRKPVPIHHGLPLGRSPLE